MHVRGIALVPALILMAPNPDYEPSMEPAAFAASWRVKFKSRPRLSAFAPSDKNDDDGPFDLEDDLLADEEGSPTAGELYHEPGGDSNWAMGSPDQAMPAMPAVDDLRLNPSNPFISLVGTDIQKCVSEQWAQIHGLNRHSLDIQVQSVPYLL
jgi:hypothetical protein